MTEWQKGDELKLLEAQDPAAQAGAEVPFAGEPLCDG